ncbi:MAG: glycosyltransferase family 39 protein [Candidatus Aenigmarchaeota archaeon]|nr:glycosyltransferase family 39 protein [Candidatus Aenigmarchaeota archaeon]
MNSYTKHLIWDEVAFLSNAKILIGETNYREDWFRPPMLSFLIGSSWFITGKNIVVAKTIVILLTTFCLWIFYKLTSTYFSNKSASVLTGLFAISYLMLYWGFRIYSDIPSLSFLILTFYWLKKEKPVNAGLAMAISFLFRFLSSIFLLAIGISLVFAKISKKKKFRMIQKFALGFLIPTSIWAAFNLAYYGDPIFQFKQNIITAARWTAPFTEPTWLQLINLGLVLNFLFPFMMIGFVLFLKQKKEWYDNIPYLYLIIFIVVHFFLINLKDMRYWLGILPWLYFWVWNGFQVAWKWKKVWLYKLSILLIICSSIIFPLWKLSEAFEVESICWSVLDQSINYIQPRVNSNDRIISDFWPYFGFFTNASISLPEKSIYSAEELERIMEEQKPKYVVIRGGIRGFEEIVEIEQKPILELEKAFSNECATIKVYRYISIS